MPQPENNLNAGSNYWLTNRTLRAKLVVTFLAVSLLILGLVTWLATYTTSTALAEKTGNTLQSLANARALATGDLLARQIDSLQTLSLNHILQAATEKQNDSYQGNPAKIQSDLMELDQTWWLAAADDPLLQSVLVNDVATELRAFQAQFPNYAEIFITDQYGALLAATNRTSDYYQADETWWQKAYNHGRGAIFVDQLVFDKSSHAFGLKIAVPVYDSGRRQVLGVIQTVYRINRLNDLATSLASGEPGLQLDLLLPDGQILARTGVGLAKLSPETLANLQRVDPTATYAVIPFEGVPRLVSQAPVFALTGETMINTLNWRIIAHQEQKTAMAAVTTQQYLIFLSAFLIAGLAALSALGFAYWLAKPITRLTALVRQIGEGNLAIQVPVSTNDEIGQLATTFNGMTTQIRQLVDSLKKEIEERNQTEVALKRSEEKFRRIFETMQDSYIFADMDGNILLANPMTSTVLGYTPQELTRLNLPADIYQNPRDREMLKQALIQKNRIRDYEILFKRKDGQVITVGSNVQLVNDETGQPIAIEGIFRDITQRKEIEQALQASNRQLAEALNQLQQTQRQLVQQERLAAVGQLAGGIAHDFNNILVPIIGYAELGLMELSPDDPLYADLQRINDAANRAAALIRQILAFSRKQVLETKPLNLNEVVVEFEKMLQRLIGEDINLKTILAPELPPVQADPAQIEQILMNLAVNARDAMPRGGTLAIETGSVVLDEQYVHKYIDVQAGPHVLLAVSDTGVGMDAATKERIFEPFFTTKPLGKGTGLGLATVFGIVKQHGGNIWVYSEPGQGTTFKIYLPPVKTVAPAAELSVYAPASVYGNETVLVVEDEMMVRALAVRTLASHGYRVLEATSPAEGLQFATEYSGTIHLLLTDVVMPQLNGRQLYEKVAAFHPKIKVLFMSGYTDNVIVHHGMLDQGVSFLQKPFTVHGLTQKVREVLG